MPAALNIFFFLFCILLIQLFFGLFTFAIAKKKGRSGSWFCMGFFLGFIGLIVVCSISNITYRTEQAGEEAVDRDFTSSSGSNHKLDKFEEIRKYKELLDEGIISEEEFEEKKKELL